MKFFIAILFSFGQIFLSAQNYNACAQNATIHVVVLGSSTAAGAGPSSSDSAWVNRYRKHLQSLNPQNQVTNLAVGGYTTYHIMPDWFSVPSRPNRNTAKNISEAIRLGADAIIVNMPSNDASNGFGVTEQLSNFRTLKDAADSANILFWLCTTQPKNFSSAASKQIQIDVKDSILAHYGNYAIDFWNGIADSSNGIKTIFDSGDGTHLNDPAHRLLNKRVINELIPNHFSDTLNFPDFAIRLLSHGTKCGDSLEQLSAIVSNLGSPILFPITLNFEITNGGLSSTSTLILPNNLNSCESDTVPFTFNSYSGGNFKVLAYLDSIGPILNNDTSAQVNLVRIGKPSISANDQYYCPNDSVHLKAISTNGTLVWYDSLAGINPIHFGGNYSVLPVQSQTDYYAEAVKGPFYFKETADLTKSTNVNFNGQMFDIIANDTLVLDSLSVPINTVASQKVVAYYRYGSHKGSESTMADWIYWGIDSATISNPGDHVNLNYNDLQLNPNDTFSVYLHLQNSGSSLSYQSSSSAVFSDSKLSMPSGSGISHTFGSIYHPRNFAGKVYYHYGFNPRGDCQSPRIKVSAIRNKAYLDLGSDTTIYGNDSLSLSASGFSNFLWSNGSSNSQITISKNTFGFGSHTIILTANDSIGCENKDSITVTVVSDIGLDLSQNTSLKISPNPSSGIIKIKGVNGPSTRIEVYSQLGVLVYKNRDFNSEIDLSHLPRGNYHIVVVHGGTRRVEKIILK